MIKRLFAVLVVLALIGAGTLYWMVGTPYKGFDKEVFVDIPAGAGTQGIAGMLAQAGVIPSEWQFLAAKAVQPGTTLKAGEYRFDRALSVLEVYRKIARGEIYYHELRIPEGSNIFDIAAELDRLGLIKRGDFLKAARDTALVRDIAPNAPSLEGYLFPSTYRLTRRTTAEQITREMVRQFRKVWADLNAPAGTDVNRIVTLASLVEKETGVPAERPEVASVYHNRLERGMKLDCDPTVIYAALLENRYRGTIYRSDLDNPHPYNTYRNPGLPPGPIANAGRASLKAALNPAQTEYLFFVAKPDGSGGHNFSETIAGHNAAVQLYRNGIAR